jgi:sugar phosphate isomerase/epimerase
MNLAGGFHLTYCSNIHPGESWSDVSAVLRDSLPRIRTLLSHEGPFGIGLRLSAGAAETLEETAEMAAFQEFLGAGNYYVFTINGFPYGAFHGTQVKERVYLPDWRTPDRLQYTNRLARLLAAMLPGGMQGSVSTVPGAFRSEVRSAADVVAIASNLLRHAAYLVALRERTGVTVTLAIEPEPACHVETIDDAIKFFNRHLFHDRAIEEIARETGVALTVDDVRRHVGLCFDVCHMAVAFEDPADALRRLHLAGIQIHKVQVSSALHVDDAEDSACRKALAQFADDTYLHQVTERGPAGLVRYVDLPDALASPAGAQQAGAREWRIHFHVPIFQATMGVLSTTQSYVAATLELLKRDGVCPYFEVETYTWNVLPSEFRATDMCAAIARELQWTRSRLEP